MAEIFLHCDEVVFFRLVETEVYRQSAMETYTCCWIWRYGGHVTCSLKTNVNFPKPSKRFELWCLYFRTFRTPANCNCILSKFDKHGFCFVSCHGIETTDRFDHHGTGTKVMCQWADIEWNKSVSREGGGTLTRESQALKFSSHSFEALCTWASRQLSRFLLYKRGCSCGAAAAKCFSISHVSAVCRPTADETASLQTGCESVTACWLSPVLRWNSGFTVCGVAGRCCRQRVSRGPVIDCQSLGSHLHSLRRSWQISTFRGCLSWPFVL